MLSASETRARTAILVVTYNSAEHLPALLDSLVRQEYHNVYFCDAASTDRSVEILHGSPFAEQVLVKRFTEGFAKNNNDLLSHFQIAQPYVMTLNPDTFFSDDLVLALARELAADDRRAIACPRFSYPDGSVQGAWRRFPSVGGALARRLRLVPADAHVTHVPGLIDWCIGACMMIDRRRLEDPQMLFDPRYRLYCEDADLCFAMRHRGFDVVATGKARVYHHLGHTGYRRAFSRHGWWNLQSMAKFYWKWGASYADVRRRARSPSSPDTMELDFV